MKKVEGKEVFKKSGGFIKEFKEFISKGNVLDMAVGVIIGQAFGKIVSSIVSDLLMPVIGVIIGGHDFTGLTVQFKDATIFYGTFIQNVVDFLIVAFCIFLVVKLFNKISHKKEENVIEEPKKDDQVVLLEEIRDLLKEKKKNNK